MILHILQHSTGRDQFGRLQGGSDQEYRNHFVTGPQTTNWLPCIVACAMGLMKFRPCPFGGESWVFHVTDYGREYMLANSQKPPKLTAGQRRYREWLRAETGMSFGRFLKMKSRKTGIHNPDVML